MSVSPSHVVSMQEGADQSIISKFLIWCLNIFMYFLSIGESLYEHVKRCSEMAKLEKKKIDKKWANQVHYKKSMVNKKCRSEKTKPIKITIMILFVRREMFIIEVRLVSFISQGKVATDAILMPYAKKKGWLWKQFWCNLSMG